MWSGRKGEREGGREERREGEGFSFPSRRSRRERGREEGKDEAHTPHRKKKMQNEKKYTCIYICIYILTYLDNFPRHGSHVGASVALDLCHVIQAPHRETVEFPPQGAGDGLPNARLSHPGGPDKAEDLPLCAALEFAHGHELQDAVFDVLEGGSEGGGEESER